MRVRSTMVALATALAVGAVLTAGASAAVVRAAHFDGQVVAVDRAARTVTVRDDESGSARVKVTRSTRFERIAGFAGVRRGMEVEVTARRSNGRWVAIEIERRRADNGRRGGRGGSGGRGD